MSFLNCGVFVVMDDGEELPAKEVYHRPGFDPGCVQVVAEVFGHPWPLVLWEEFSEGLYSLWKFPGVDRVVYRRKSYWPEGDHHVLVGG